MATTKVITFRGHQYTVPIWTKFVAMDSDGSLFAYAERPYIDDDYDWMPADDRHGQPTACERISAVAPDWRDSLTEV